MRGLFGMTAVVLLALTAPTGCRSDGEPTATPDAKESNGEAGKEATMDVKSAAFGPGETIPKKYTGEGDDSLPPLAWSGAPENTKNQPRAADPPDASGQNASRFRVRAEERTESALGAGVRRARPSGMRASR